MHLPKLRPIRFCTHRYVVCIMGKKKKFQRDRRKKIAKVATGNRQNRHMAEFRESFEMKVVEHQILCGKLISQANFKPPSPKLDYFKVHWFWLLFIIFKFIKDFLRPVAISKAKL